MRQVTLVAAIVLSVAFVILPSTNAVVCTNDICSRVRCANNTPESCATQGLKFVKDGGFCGCCSACVKIIKTGENCLSVRGVPSQAKCEDGSVCKNNVCVQTATLIAEAGQ